jgi:hypothetical protein
MGIMEQNQPPDPARPIYIWGDKQIKEARNILNLRFDEAPFSVETVQQMLSLLIEKLRNDPEQIERVIVQHFTKKRKIN